MIGPLVPKKIKKNGARPIAWVVSSVRVWVMFFLVENQVWNVLLKTKFKIKKKTKDMPATCFLINFGAGPVYGSGGGHGAP
jgi:hypothetical protein